MKTDTIKAKKILEDEELTLVIIKDTTVYKSVERGVLPLLDFIDKNVELDGFCVADKVVGAGAAFLYILLGVDEIYAKVISTRAEELLKSNGISVTFGMLVNEIRNRAGSDRCPIEAVVEGIFEPYEALLAIRKRLSEMSKP